MNYSILNSEPEWFKNLDMERIYADIEKAEQEILAGDKGKALEEVFDNIDSTVFNIEKI